ncbi:hypothetical protein [Arsukibacterium perlucidum]|uniref:hypothetical protein n=1 Tax=Arsukibacterium perlucidum TaxID=368811 RepID=UPI00035CE514|nr:hypothetical protein [Arsukibacterium perlucidum]
MSNFSKSFQESPYWYHGTSQQFDSWLCPPPQKPGDEPLVAHKCLFFTSNIDFASGAGSWLARVSLASHANILDATANYNAAEQLRRKIKDLDLISQTLNVQHDFWHQHWKTGHVLRAVFTDPLLQLEFNRQINNIAHEYGIPEKVAEFIFKQNITRGLIETICTAARILGYDGIFGYEIDKNPDTGREISQPWLAVFSKETISTPYWMTEEELSNVPKRCFDDDFGRY